MNFPLKNYILFFVLILLALFLFFPNSTPAGAVTCYTPCNEQVTCGSTSRKGCDWSCSTCTDENGNSYSCNCGYSYYCTQYHCSGSWIVYRAGNVGCGPTIENGTCKSGCSGDGSGCCTCGGCKLECTKDANCEVCESWQKAKRDSCAVSSWGQTKPACVCNGNCLEAPTNPKYYYSPSNSIEATDTNNILLPVKLDWNDVPGWIGGYGGNFAMDCSSGGKICYNSSGAGQVNWDAYHACESSCIDNCMQQALNEHPTCPCVGQLRTYASPCTKTCSPYLSGANAVCQSPTYTPATNPTECTSVCPASQGNNACYPPDAFVQYYEIEIDGPLRDCSALIDISNGGTPRTSLNIDKYTAFLGASDGSEFIPPCSCFFESGKAYTWKVRACCSNNESSCGPWSSTWSFKTSLAPEPAWPYDTNWMAPGGAQHVPVPVTLDWCDIDYMNVGNYIIRAYQNGQEEPSSPIPVSASNFADGVLRSEYSDAESQFFTKEINYQWKVAACAVGTSWADCEKEGASGPFYSQTWEFHPTGQILPPTLIAPPDDPNGENAVGLPVTLDWSSSAWAHSYLYQLTPAMLDGESASSTAPSQVTLSWDLLALNTFYKWKVKSCWDYNGEDCEPTSSVEWTFKTTGAPPKNITMTKDDTGKALIPLKIDWEDISGAGSYYIEIAGDSSFSTSTIVIPEEKRVAFTSDVSFGYPYIKMDTAYWIRIKTCADREGKICGPYSTPVNFTTFRLSAPTNLSPGSNSNSPTEVQWNKLYLSWDKLDGAVSYWYDVESEDTEKVGSPPALAQIDPINGVGKVYQWRVKACIDNTDITNDVDNPTICGDWSAPLYIKTVEPQNSGGGLVPCGRSADDPSTPYNERESCQFKDIFLLITNILNFVLWKLIPIILVIEVAVTGLIFYFSRQMERTDTIGTVRTFWRATGIGLGVVFFAWLFINFLLVMLGYQVSIFGHWWQINI